MQPYSKSTEENIIKDLLLNQGTLVEILKIIHLFGAGFYIGLTASISAFFCCRYADNISNKTEFIMAVVFIGIVFGIIWNITGYYRDKRYFLAKFIDRIPQSSAREKDELFRLTWNNIKGNIVSIISLFLISAVIILFANDSLLKSETLLQLTTEYNFVTVLYVMLIAIYLRNGYKLLYPQTQDDADLFPSITFMLDMKSKRSIKHTSQEAHTK